MPIGYCHILDATYLFDILLMSRAMDAFIRCIDFSRQ